MVLLRSTVPQSRFQSGDRGTAMPIGLTRQPHGLGCSHCSCSSDVTGVPLLSGVPEWNKAILAGHVCRIVSKAVVKDRAAYESECAAALLDRHADKLLLEPDLIFIPNAVDGGKAAWRYRQSDQH
jgi:hypothetical protein